jgi:hypothetical protein
MEIGEEEKILTEVSVLGCDGLLDLHHEIGCGPQLVRSGLNTDVIRAT